MQPELGEAEMRLGSKERYDLESKENQWEEVECERTISGRQV